DRGLDQFIFNTIFTGAEWSPLYVDSVLDKSEPEPSPESNSELGKLSIRTIASVVEALVGAGWRMGGHPIALAAVKAFIPEVDMESLESARLQLYNAEVSHYQLPKDLQALETLVGYTFKKKGLLTQSMTHGSDMTAEQCYDRLEFLGDAILETIVTSELLQYDSHLSQSHMHRYRTALVNGDYLGYVALDWCTTQYRFDLEDDEYSRRSMRKVEKKFRLPLWKFMRHLSKDIARQQATAEARFDNLHGEIAEALESGTSYPWAILATLQPNNFFSEVVKSVIGAVWIDSGSIDESKKLMERMGIIPLLHRLVRDKVYALHPREKLAQLINSKDLRYEVSPREIENTKKGWTATVFIGEIPLIENVWSESAEGAKTLAADKVLSLEMVCNGGLG
ncbi:ribonuclease III, partial [Thozetella sp. PMI_491]